MRAPRLSGFRSCLQQRSPLRGVSPRRATFSSCSRIRRTPQVKCSKRGRSPRFVTIWEALYKSKFILPSIIVGTAILAVPGGLIFGTWGGIIGGVVGFLAGIFVGGKIAENRWVKKQGLD